MKKKWVFILFLIMIALYSKVSAQELMVWQKDGSMSLFSLNEQPKATFTMEDLVITTKSVTVNYPLGNILRFTYEGTSMSIGSVKGQLTSVIHYQNEIVVVGLKSGKPASIYSVDGKQVVSKISNGKDSTVLPLGNLPVGVYVVKAEGINYKFTKR